MRYEHHEAAQASSARLEQGFLAGFAAALLAIGVTVLTVGAAKRLRARNLTGTKLGIDSNPPRSVELAAQPAPEANASKSPRLESEMADVMLPEPALVLTRRGRTLLRLAAAQPDCGDTSAMSSGGWHRSRA